MSNFTEATLIEWLVDNVDNTIRKAEDKFSAFDIYSKGTDRLIELKCRRKHYPDLMIEKKKFDKLIKFGEALYICSTPEGIYQWVINWDSPIEWEIKRMPAKTDFGDRRWVDKEVGFLEIKDAEKLF